MAKATGVEVARISVKVSPNTKEFRADLKRELEEIERTIKGDVHLNAHLNTAQARADFERMKDQMQRAGNIKVGVDVVAGKSGKQAEEARKSIFGFLSGGGGKGGMPDFPSFGSGINPAGWAAILAGVVALAAPLLGIITSALLALPGIVGLLTAPIAAVTLGLDGFKKAAEKIKPQFEELKAVMSEVAETAFTPVLQNIAEKIFPQLKEALPAVTKGLANFAQGAVDAFSRPENAAKFQGSLTRIGQAFNDMRPGMDGFMSGFIGLIDQFSLKLPAIKDWFNDLGTDFDAWVQKISADGSLGRAFDGLGGILKEILDTVGELALSGLEWIQDPAKVEDFKNGLSDLLGVLEDIASLSSTLTDMFSNIIPSFNWDGIKEDVLEPFTSENAPWRKMFDGIEGNGGAAFTNRGPGGGGVRQQLDDVKTSIEGVEAAADSAAPKVDGLIAGGGGANASRERRGLAPVGEVPTPNLEPAKAEITEYQSFVDNVSQQVRGALSQATSGESLPAPNFEAFKAAWQELPRVVQNSTDQVKSAAQNASNGVVEGFNRAGEQITAAVNSWPPLVTAVGPILYAAGNEAGMWAARGMADGINAGTPMIAAAAQRAALAAKASAEAALDINSPSRVFEKIGGYTAEGFGVGLENGFQPVLEQAKDLASKVADVFASGGDPTGLLSGYSNGEVARIGKVLAFESRRLENQAKAFDWQARNAGPGALADSLKARADEIRKQKEQISLQKDMLDLTREYSGELGGSGGEDPFVKAASGLMNAPVDFAKATGKQFLSDLGINGDGFISKAITEGISYVFNIASVDEAMSVKDRQDSKSAMSIVGR